MSENRLLRWVVGTSCALGLLAVFLFQRTDFAGDFLVSHSNIVRFIVNRSIRFLLNDLMAIGLIYALFGKRRYVLFSLWVQLTGMVVFLFPYFALKIYYPVYNGPLLSFLHRLILNPTLLLLLIPAFYYQGRVSQS